METHGGINAMYNVEIYSDLGQEGRGSQGIKFDSNIVHYIKLKVIKAVPIERQAVQHIPLLGSEFSTHSQAE